MCIVYRADARRRPARMLRGSRRDGFVERIARRRSISRGSVAVHIDIQATRLPSRNMCKVIQ